MNNLTYTFYGDNPIKLNVIFYDWQNSSSKNYLN